MIDLNLVIFDMDGTLMDSQEFIQLGMATGIERAGYPAVSRAAVQSIIGLSFSAAISVLIPHLDQAENQRVTEVIQQTYIELRSKPDLDPHTALYAGARDALERLHLQDEILMGVATGKAMRGLVHAYDRFDLHKFFITSQTADMHPSKPHPSMLHTALGDTGVDVGRAIMVGDTEFDIAMGRAAGFSTIGVSWGYHSVDRINAAGADLIIDDFSELDAALKQLWT